MTAIEPADPITFDLRLSALLVFLTYIEEKRRLRPTSGPSGPEYDAGYFEAIEAVRNYVRALVEPERVAS